MVNITHTRKFNWFGWLADFGQLSMILVAYLIILNTSEGQNYIQTHFIVQILGLLSLFYFAKRSVSLMMKEHPQHWTYTEITRNED